MYIFHRIIFLLLATNIVCPVQVIVGEQKLSEGFYGFYCEYFKSLFEQAKSQQKASSSLVTLIRLENLLHDKMTGYDLNSSLEVLKTECKRLGYTIDDELVSEYLSIHNSVNKTAYSYRNKEYRDILGPGTEYTAYFGLIEVENQPIDPELQKRIDAIPYRFTIAMSMALGGSFLIATRVPFVTATGKWLLAEGVSLMIWEIISKMDDYDGFEEEDEDAVYDGDLD